MATQYVTAIGHINTTCPWWVGMCLVPASERQFRCPAIVVATRRALTVCAPFAALRDAMTALGAMEAEPDYGPNVMPLRGQ